jgi:hypothetical protein
MEDVSRSGARFVSTVPVEPGGRMRLLLRPSEEARPPVTVAGRIVWVTKPAVPWMGRYQAGLAFDPPSRRVVAGLR